MMKQTILIGFGFGFVFLAIALLLSCSTSHEVADFQASPQAVPETEVHTLAIGSPAPDFRLPGVDGRFYRLADFSDAAVLAIIFTCNHCPTAQAYEARMKKVTDDYRSRGVQIVAVSPNSPLGLLYEELGYTDMGDTYEEMQVRAADAGFNFPYLYDGDTQAMSIQYGPVATPHAFVFDSERILRYSGRLDGSEKPGTANAEDLRGALDALLSGQPVPTPVTKSFGCSTKWAWKSDWKQKVDREWSEAPVSVAPVDVEGVKALLANDSEKLRLINVWATWCGPCVIEYPEFIEIHRMYKDRAFEFVSLSADAPDNRDEVLKFLESRDSAVRNLQFALDDQYALIEAVDPQWNGALPFTILVEPGGRPVYKVQGTIDPLELKRTIVDHPMVGRYY
jgi:peroxiredoxin